MLFKNYCNWFIYSDYKKKYNKYKENYIKSIYSSSKETINLTLTNYFKSIYNYELIIFWYKYKKIDLINNLINKDKNNLVIYFYLLYESEDNYYDILEEIKKEYRNLDLYKFRIKRYKLNQYTYIDYINKIKNDDYFIFHKIFIYFIILYVKFKYILNEIEKKIILKNIVNNKTIKLFPN